MRKNTKEQIAREALAYIFIQVRREMELTQDQVAEGSRLSRQYISMIERQERSPNFLTLVKLCHGLKIDLLDFMTLVVERINRY